MDIERDIIREKLAKFQATNGVDIILAVESGSRGWGFASADSDYDIRGVYKYPVSRYLDLEEPSASHDWLETKYDFELFDIYKFYDLLGKSNMNIIDWVMQHNIYFDKLIWKGMLIDTIETHFDRRTYVSHNFGLAYKNYTRYFNSNAPNEPTAKRYVYCIRALLSAQHCMKNDTLAPIMFDDLIECSLNMTEQDEIREMLEVKKKDREKTQYSNPKWKKWIETHLKDENTCKESKNHSEYIEKLNANMKLQLGVEV